MDLFPPPVCNDSIVGMIRILPKLVGTALLASLLVGCGDSGSGGFTSGTTISGTVRVTRSTVLRSKASAPSAAADLGGLTSAGAGVTVQLVRLNSQGQDPAVLATTTTDSSGGYSFAGANIPPPATTLAVQVAGQSSNMEALVIGAQVDITPASEAVFAKDIANSPKS